MTLSFQPQQNDSDINLRALQWKYIVAFLRTKFTLKMKYCLNSLVKLFNTQHCLNYGEQYNIHELEFIYTHEITKRHRDKFSFYTFVEINLHWKVYYLETGVEFKISGHSRGPSFILLQESPVSLTLGQLDAKCHELWELYGLSQGKIVYFFSEFQ